MRSDSPCLECRLVRPEWKVQSTSPTPCLCLMLPAKKYFKNTRHKTSSEKFETECSGICQAFAKSIERYNRPPEGFGLSRHPTQHGRILGLANDFLEGRFSSGLYLGNELAHGCDGADIGHSLSPPCQASRRVAQDVPDKHAGRIHGKCGDVFVEGLFPVSYTHLRAHETPEH